MDYLCELPNDAARRKALDSLPPDLNSTYERILDRVNQSNPETQKLVQRALRWIACEYALPSQALCEAVSVDLGSTNLNSEAIPDEYEILHWCSSLIRKSADGEELELAHFTVKEFLQQIDSSRDVSIAAYRIHDETDEISLAKVCLTYLNFKDFDESVPPDTRSSNRRLSEYPFRYCAVYMSQHVNFNNVDDHELVSLAQKLWSPSKSNNFISWMCDSIATLDDDWPEYEEGFSAIRSGFAETTALHWMAMCSYSKMCSWLLDSGCDVNRSSAFGTPLHCALIGLDNYGYHFQKKPTSMLSLCVLENDANDDLVILLLGAGADLDLKCAWGPKKLSTLLIALLFSNSKIVMRLLDEGGVFDDQCLDMLERHLDNEEICDIINHATKQNVEPNRCGRLLQLAVEAETPNATRLIQKDNGSPLKRTECEDMLRTAAEFGQLDIVRGLLENQRLDVDAADESTGMTALHHAATFDQLEIAQTLMAHGADSSRSDSQGRNALHYSLEGRDVRCLGFLLRQDADTSLLDMQGMSVLHQAAQDGHVRALSILLSRSEDQASVSDLKTKDGRTPLLCASASNSKEAISLLLDAGCSLTETASDGSSPLHYAVRSGSVEVVKFLLEMGVDPHKTRDEERTPLQDLVDLIKEGSSSPDELDFLFAASQMLLKSSLERSRTAPDMKLGSELVYLACLHNFPSAEKTVSALLDFSLDLNADFDDGNTALMAAAKSGKGVILSNLIRHGADPCSNDSGLNALIYACQYGRTDIFVHLRGTRIDWNFKTTAVLFGEHHTGVTALHLAASMTKSNTLTFLLNEGLVSDINVRTDLGYTPLLLAGRAGASRNLSILLSHDADIAYINEQGDSVVHIAATLGHRDVISELMRHDSHLGLQNSRGLTPELLARKHGHESLANTILHFVNSKSHSHQYPNTLVRIS